MIGENDMSDEITTLQDVANVVAFAKTNGLTGLHYWSFDRDTPCVNQPSSRNATPTCNSQSRKPLQFDQAFLMS